MKLGASFSDDRRYRWKLFRTWQPRLPVMVWILLNPSTADETRDDPTIKRCVTRAINAGYGGVEILNLFAWRSTDPRQLYQVADPVGERNDEFICAAAGSLRRLMVCGWGRHGTLHGRGEAVRKLIRRHCTPHVLRLNSDGSPEHPLYVPYSVSPTPWPESQAISLPETRSRA